MQCRYCRAWNSHEEHRCTRCGRRMVASARSIPEAYPIQTATAPELLDERGEEPVSVEVRTGPPRPVYQRSLFREMQQVVQMPALRSAVRPSAAAPRSKPARRVPADQQSLDFEASNARAAMETVIYCNAPVAQPMHRAMAAAFDGSMIVMGMALFGAAFRVAGGTIVLDAKTLPVYVGIGAVLAFFYHLLVAMLGGGRTPGMSWTRLELLDFDGRRPIRNRRMRRLFAGLLSTLAAGLGLLWALVDEEKLTWHDHISRTFPTPQRWEE